MMLFVTLDAKVFNVVFFLLIYNRWQTGASNKLRESGKWWIYSNGDTCCLMKTTDFSFFHTVITALLSFHLKVFRLWYRFVGLLECSPPPWIFLLQRVSASVVFAGRGWWVVLGRMSGCHHHISPHLWNCSLSEQRDHIFILVQL